VPALVLAPHELEAELLAMTDHYTDEIFALPAAVATMVRFPVSRLVVDPERFTDDAQEPMAARGMGVIYTRTSAGLRLRAQPTPAERAALLARFYEPHHRALTEAVSGALAAHGACLVVDGHSFPSKPLPYELDQHEDRPDVCIGTDAFHTPEWLRDAAVAEFEREGLRVAVDRPFAGALVPMAFYRSEARVMALMVELNRALYMHEHNGAMRDDFAEFGERVQRALHRVWEVWLREVARCQ
jgi:N-formylglutamate amidohydrolase